jgi:hypothetical protein
MLYKNSRRLFVGIVLVFAISSFVIFQTPDNTLTDKERKQGWVLLFNGESTEGWRPFKNRQADSWEVVNGELVNKTEGVTKRADLITNEQFENFELLFDWKLKPQGNSGLIYLVTEDNGATYESGPEYSLIDDEGYPEKLNDVQKSGANYDVHAPSVAAAKPVGEYNRSRIIVNNSRVEHWLNGKKVVEYEIGSPEWESKKNNSKWKDVKPYAKAKKGHLALQDHGGGVWFKNIKVRKLK